MNDRTVHIQNMFVSEKSKVSGVISFSPVKGVLPNILALGWRVYIKRKNRRSFKVDDPRKKP